MKVNILYFVLLIAILSSCYNKTIFPSGWRLTEKNDYLEEDFSCFRNGIPNYIEADFNGDSKNDQAWIFIRDNLVKFGMFVKLSNKNSIQCLQEINLGNDLKKVDMGIYVVKPGTYITAQGKGYGVENPDEPDEITIQYPSIDFQLFESANSFFYWDDDLNDFKRIWISD